MKKLMEAVMTKLPHSIGDDIDLSVAEEQMKKYQIRHLPVLNRGKVVGILTDRDVKLAVKFGKGLTVGDVMTPDPYVVGPDANVSEVFGRMAEGKFGSVIVAEKEKPVGIFTAVDGMRLLSEIYK